MVEFGDHRFFVCDLSYFNPNEPSAIVDGQVYVERELPEEFSGILFQALIRERVIPLADSHPTYSAEVGIYEVEDVRYEIAASPRNSAAARTDIESVGLPRTRAKYYARATETTPEHSLGCNRAPSAELGEQFQCTLLVRYAGGQLHIRRVLGTNFKDFGYAPFSLDGLPRYVRGLHRAFEVMEAAAASNDAN